MLSSLISRFHDVFPTQEADVTDASASLKQRLACAPPDQTTPLVANDHLRGFLCAVMRQHGEGRIPDGDWGAMLHFLTGRREALPASVAHLALQWPRARSTGLVLHALLRRDRAGADDTVEHTISRLQVLLAYLKEQVQEESWLSHGFKVEFQAMCLDAAIGPLDRIEVVDMAVLQLGPMGAEELHACVHRIARLLGLLPPDAYPCVRDVLSRIANEASWQLDLFAPLPEPAPQAQRWGMSLAE